MADVTDKMIGGFRILAEIKGASGSQGQIFKAVCENPPFAGIEPGTVVALKAMAVHDEDGQVWAKLEKRTGELVLLSHPNVVKYYGCFSEPGTFNDTHAIVQEYLEGETLKQRLARCPSGLDADVALHVTEAALAGLEYTASKGIVHRDIKPANIFLCLDKDGAIVGVKLIDFEIARQEGGTTTSASGNLVGSFDYMSPDFTNSTFRGDEQSDVFSMGVVMHEAITGRTPYQRIEGSSGRADFAFLSRWVRLHVDGTNPIRISSRANRLLAHSDEVLAKALAPLPQNRYESFSAFRAGLKSIRYRDLRNGNNVYRVLQLIGKGGFGEVFKARLKGCDRLVAIKHLLKEAYAKRFYREAKIMASLDDSCFVHFVDFFVVRHAGRREAFLVMDFLPGMPGSSLRDAIKRAGGAALPFRETLLAFARFAHGLCALHARGIFHRDIKPSNLYFPEGHPECAAIMDLGIARDAHGSITSGQVPGTLDYMPPEVVLTENRGDAGMDIYALGLCLYEALSGKTAYPRLPQGPSAIASFLARANIKAMPDLSDPSIVENAPLHDLLVRMTHPELSERITDTSAVERALAALAGVAQMPEVPVGEEYAPAGEEDARADALFESAVEEETRPAPQDNPFTAPADPKTIKTIETIQQTVQTKPPPPVLDIGAGNEAENQRKEARQHERRARILRGLALAAVAVVACLGAVWACRGWFVANADDARKEAEAVVRMYAGRGLEDGRIAKGKWLKRWTPQQGNWVVDLDRASFAACTNRIHAEEVKLLDVAAENAAVEVESSYSNTKNATAECDRKFEEWRKEWAQQCSTTKFSELEGRIKEAQYGKYNRAGVQLTMRYQIVTNTLKACDGLAETWKKKRPDGFPDDEFNKLVSNVDQARAKRIEMDRKREGDLVRENDRHAAESALGEVVKSYDAGTAVGDREAAAWRKNWKEKLDDKVFSEMDTQIATAGAKRAEIERQQRIQAKKKEFEADCRRVAAGYRDDSSDKAKTDEEYDEWSKKWNADRDVPADWRARFEEIVKKEKAAREKRIAQADEEVKATAVAALQDVIGAYDASRGLDVGDEKAKAWRQAWKEKLSADAYSQMNVQIDNAREKRVNHDEWEKKQRILASKTNEVEAVRATLVKGYEGDSGKNKSNLDSQFDAWARRWEADEVLRKSLPNWFAGRKRTVEDAKSAYEARIAEAKRKRHVADKTKEAEAVRKQLEDGYRIDTSDKPQVDRDFTKWMLKWSADSDLPPGWFAEQRKAVEKVKVAREARDAAVREAELVCDFYRTAGVEEGNVRREKWKAAWTNKLDVATFQKLSERIDADREGRVKRDKDESLEKKMVEVESACTNLVENYITDTIPKADTDKLYNQKLKEWEDDEVLKGVWSWFSEQKRKVDVAQSAREQRDKEKRAREERDAARRDAELVCDMYRNAGMAAGDVLRKKWDDDWTNKLESATLSELLQRIEKVRKEVMPPPEPPKPVVDYALVTKTNRVETVCAGLVKDYEDAAIPKANTDIRYERTLADWNADQDLNAESLKNWLAEQKRKVEDAKRMREHDEVVRLRQEAGDAAREICETYRNDGVQTGDGSRKWWNRTWTNRLDSSTFRELSRKIDEARTARVQIDEERERGEVVTSKTNQVASACEDLVKDYENDAVRKTDTDNHYAQRVKEWEADKDLNKESLKDWIAGQKRKVEDAKLAREQREDGKRIADKQKQAEGEADNIVRAYGNEAIQRVETDQKFDTWRDTWGNDADLPSGWFDKQRSKISNAQDTRIKADKRRQDRKDANDAANDVCGKYETAGVDAGNSARRLWDVEWKTLLDEATYKEISAVIDHARDKAQAKAEGERLEKEIKALLEVDQNQVERWKEQLADAERKIVEGKALLGQEKVDDLKDEVARRKKWVVGVVANRTDRVIKVGGRSINPGQREYFKLPGGMPQGGWQVSSAGYKQLTIDQSALDGSVVSVGDGKWKLEPIPKARVHIPQLGDGVTCRLDGAERRSGEQVEVDSGKELNYVYSLKGHEDQGGSFSVQGGESKELPPPNKDWKVNPEFEEWCQDRLDDVESALRSKLGLTCLEVYHEMYMKGYRLDRDDLANVEKAWKICDEDFSRAKDEAIKKGRYDLRAAEEVWQKARRLYNVLTGKRVTVEDAPR